MLLAVWSLPAVWSLIDTATLLAHFRSNLANWKKCVMDGPTERWTHTLLVFHSRQKKNMMIEYAVILGYFGALKLAC